MDFDASRRVLGKYTVKTIWEVNVAHLSKHPTGKWRVRYILVFPDGSKADRSRLFASLREAKMMLHRAGLMEEAVRFRHYTAEDLAEWRALGLISERDRRLLSAIFMEGCRYPDFWRSRKGLRGVALQPLLQGN